jgi:hypothetical protein
MKRFSVICLQCGLSVDRLIDAETAQTDIHPVTYQQKCKIAPNAADFDCPDWNAPSKGRDVGTRFSGAACIVPHPAAIPSCFPTRGHNRNRNYDCGGNSRSIRTRTTSAIFSPRIAHPVFKRMCRSIGTSIASRFMGQLMTFTLVRVSGSRPFTHCSAAGLNGIVFIAAIAKIFGDGRPRDWPSFNSGLCRGGKKLD